MRHRCIASTAFARCRYEGIGSTLTEKAALPPYRYGIDQRTPKHPILTVCDHRASKGGVYVGNSRQHPRMRGNGIVSLDGIDPKQHAALVTCYGQGSTGLFKGGSGTLWYVPIPH